MTAVEQFGRRCRITVGEEGGTGVLVDEQFRVVFTVQRTIGQEVNSSLVEVYGLSPDTRKKFLEPNQVCRVEAGYKDNVEVLGIADITRALVRREPPDIVTELQLGDGARALRDRKVNLSFEAGASVQRVLDRIAQELALGSRATGVQVEGAYREGVSFSGTAREALNSVTKRAGVVWSIQNGDLQISDRKLANQGRGVLLRPNTGLIRSPEPLEDREQETEQRRGAGYRVWCLLNPKIIPGDRLVIESAEVEGTFRVDSVQHSGDTRGNEWLSEVEVYAE
ncbi:MAG: hypothetical protein FKY71_08335 [Spiribacter salinus]|uniref:Uncharacterized protein n=1 Tax=Spiribacter salinus TaxID=1335746 RepID=A0A540VRW1_9GAMM|nr:MAG: hypothetical protein FKY71_08335 [Spiribacter salinus]